MRNLKKLRCKIVLLFLLISIFLGFIFFFYNFRYHLKSSGNKQTQASNKSGSDESKVLGQYTPQIFISGGREEYSVGGMIALASTDEPAVYLESYDVTGSVEVNVYKANEEALLNYLVHDKDGKQLKKDVDTSKFNFVTKVTHSLGGSPNNSGSKLTLPLDETGIWFLKITKGSLSVDSFIIRSNVGVVVKEGDNEYIFWGQSFKTKRSVTEGEITLYNLTDNKKEITKTSFGSEGIAKTNLTADADIALVKENGELSVVPINLEYLNAYYSYHSFQPKNRQTKYFIFTDRPLYRPGDTVYFKSVLRDDDDARYTIPSGSVKVKIYTSWDEKDVIFEKNYPISADGTLNGEYALPKNKTGYFRLVVSIPGSTQSETSFDAEFFRKPDYSIDITTSKTELIAGDKTSFKISGSYFSGQPLSNQKVKYTVYSSDFYEYEYLVDRSYELSDDYRYGYWGGTKVLEKEAILNQKGEAEVNLEPQIPAGKGQNQVFSIEATFDDNSGNPAFTRKNILVFAGEYGIYRKDSNYSGKILEPFSLPINLVSRRSTSVSGISLSAKIHRENWVAYQEPNKKYPSYRKEEEDLPEVKTKTDSGGNATFAFTPQKVGSYTITVQGKDGRNNLVSKAFYAYITSEDQPYYKSGQSDSLSLQIDKPKYLPQDTVHLTVNSSISQRDALLTFERERVNRFQVVHLNSKNTTLDLPLVATDMPNIFVQITSFSNDWLNSDSANVLVSTDTKKLIVKTTPSQKTLGPGENLTVNVETTDVSGNPVSANVAVWAVDKALFELVDEKPEKIFDTFWSERWNGTQTSHSLAGIAVLRAERGGGCFAEGTSILMKNGETEAIEKVNVGDVILTRESDKSSKLVEAKVSGTHQNTVSGYFVINDDLKVTSNHMLWVGNSWKEASLIKVGDTLIDSQGKEVTISSIEWVAGKFTVYNLQIEKYQTFFAQGFWVHNQKGGARTIFKDTAYWNPSIRTDISGRAQVTFKLPDNLTTWVIAGIGSTTDTKVGQTTSEVVVTKDLIVRPILPNVLRTGDDVNISALVQNSTDQDGTFDIDLKFDAGDVKDATRSAIIIKSKDMVQIDWQVSPKQEKEKAKFTFSARSKENKKLTDTIVQEISVLSFGFWEQKAEVGDGTKDFSVKLSQDSDREKSSITLSFAPTLVGMLPTAAKYLIDYPYGCVEQTTSRFVPALIAKSNPSLFQEALKDKNLNDIIDKSISRLGNLQHWDGGWSWWSNGDSSPFVSAYVVEYLVEAKNSGFAVDNNLIGKAQGYLEKQDSKDSPEDIIAKNYALTILGSDKRKAKIDNLSNLSPDILSLAVIANFKNGDKNPQTNGLAKLESAAQVQGDGVFWSAGTKTNFGSQEASTALTIRAITIASANRDLAVKGVRFLARNRNWHYWHNTFATAQVMRALVDFSKTGSELVPNYSYKVSVDGKEIIDGLITDSKQTKEVTIPISKIKSEGSIISIEKTGEGQLYSTLLVKEFRTDRQAKAVDHGLIIKREYISDKGYDRSLALGDTVTVRLIVEGLKTDENYGVITDELPSGLVPVNQLFKNEQYSQDPTQYYYSSYGVTDMEITQNGAVLSLYKLGPVIRTYTYKARVISEGAFTVPPASVSLMYAPEIYGQSSVQVINTTKSSEVIRRKIIQSPFEAVKEKVMSNKNILLPVAIILIIFVFATISVFAWRNHWFSSLKVLILKLFRHSKTSPPNHDYQNDQSESQNSKLNGQ